MFFHNSAGRVTAALLVALLAISPALPAQAAQRPNSDRSITVRGLSESIDLPAYTLADFINNEALAIFNDGSCEVYSYNDEASLKAGIEALNARSDVAFVQPNFVYSKESAPNDEYFTRQWALFNDGSFAVDEQDTVLTSPSNPYGSTHLFGANAAVAADSLEQAVAGADIDMVGAWDSYRPERQAVVALIDTGVDMSHPDLPADAFWTNSKEIPDNGIDDDGNGYVDDIHGWDFYYGNNTLSTGSQDAHGTHCAGTVAAARGNGIGIAGIGGDGSVKVMPLKVLGGRGGTGTTANVIKAIHYAERNGAAICNMSMGADTLDVALYLAMANSPMLFVVSSGNDGYNTDRIPSYPASFDLNNVLAVANMKPNGKLHYTSNYGARTVDIAAPGTSILSTAQGGGYGYMTGTSMAAPVVSGVCALVYASSASLQPQEVRTIVMETARRSSAVETRVVSGVIDAAAALDKVRSIHSNAADNNGLPYTDVAQSSEYYDAIKAMHKAGLMVGTSSTTFSPEQPLNRGTVITILGRLAKAEVSSEVSFYDVSPTDWYAGYVNWAADNGIIVGYGDGRFGPLDDITAEQLNAILSRYARLIGREYDSGLSGETVLTRAQTAAALYDFCKALDISLD